MNNKNLLIALFALIERENAVSIPQIATLLGSDEKTVWEQLEKLVFAYDSAALRLELETSHAYLQRSTTNQILRLNREETDILLDVLAAHGFTEDDEFTQRLIRAKGILEHGDGNADGADAPRLHSTAHGVCGDVLQQLAAACDSEPRHLVCISYQKDGAPAPQQRRVEPHALRTEGDKTYLEAFDPQHNGWRSFRVDRIQDVQVLDTACPAREHPSEPHTAFSAVIRFAPGSCPDDWPGLQVVRTLEDGSVEACVPWYGSLWLPKRIIASCGLAQALEPPELRTKCVELAHNMLHSLENA